jgi:hypothetical protein
MQLLVELKNNLSFEHVEKAGPRKVMYILQFNAFGGPV